MPSGSPRRFLLAVALSLALHAIVISELAGVLFRPEPQTPTLSAELRPVEPPPPAPPVAPRAPAAVKPAAPTPKPAPRLATPAAPTPDEPLVAPTSEAPAAGAPPVEPEAEPARAPDPAPVAEAAAPAEPELEPPAAEPLVPAQDALPPRGTITYDLLYGGGPIGRSEQHWHIEGSTYRLSSHSRTTGLLGMLLPYQFDYTSEGSIGPHGLQPRKFSARRGRGGSRQAAAEFDWQGGEIVLGPLGEARTLPLAPGTQDLLSFVFQLARTPLAPGRRTMTITSGHKLESYVLDITAEESIELPLGTMRAVPVRQVRAPGEERLELWLAADPPRLPVRLRFFDRDGNLTVEQIATRIETHGT